MRIDRLVSVLVVALIYSTCGGLAYGASSYPSKPITVVVSYPPGGDTDTAARLFAEKLGESLHQTVVVENKSGAGGVIGNAFVSRAAADGYTLLFAPNQLTTAPMVLKLPPAASYDPLNSFEPVVQTTVQPIVLVTHPRSGFKSVKDMIDAAKSGRPVSYASPGAGSSMHIVAEWLNKEAGTKIQHVPYRGVAPEVSDVVAGHVDTAWVTLGAVLQYISVGRLVPLAVAAATRSRLIPNVPTLRESGYQDVIVTSWNGFFAPKGTPNEIIQRLNSTFNEILKQPEVVGKLATYGASPQGGEPAVLDRTNRSDYEVIGSMIQALNITSE